MDFRLFARRVNASFLRHVISTVGISVLQQFAGLGRQALIAAYYGLSREFDSYLIAYAVATMVVFNLASVFDTVAVSRLVQIREREGDAAFWRASNRLLLKSGVAAILFSAGFVILLHLALPIVAAGFDQSERALVSDLALYFTPWVIIIIPYYAVSAHLKALWQFHWVFAAELLAIVASMAVLWARHDSISCLPIAYGAGYLIAFIGVAARRGIMRAPDTAPPPGFMRAMANQYLANQTGTLASLADRFFQSFLSSGGISALGYTGLIVNNLSSLMTFREIYVTPLASDAGRNERLERMMCGIVLLSFPITGFIITFAEPIVRVLFQRGSFTAAGTELTATTLQIMTLSLLFSSVLAPLARLFQILDRISYTYLLYLFSFVVTSLLQFVLVFWLRLDVYGIAWATVGNSAGLTLFVVAMLRHCGVHLNWRVVFRDAALAFILASIGVAISGWLESKSGDLAGEMIAGVSYWAVIAAGYYLARARLLEIIR